MLLRREATKKRQQPVVLIAFAVLVYAGLKKTEKKTPNSAWYTIYDLFTII